jgi:hypothetical protein
MVTYIIGDLLTGDRIQILPALAGSWSEELNDSGELSCTVSLRNPAVKRMMLDESAAVGKAFLAAVEGDTVLQAGPIWNHEWDGTARKLTLHGAGMLSYFDHRVVLPVLSGRLPTDPTTDTRYMPQDLDPESEYPWPTDTRRSLQGIMVGLFEQALSWPSGNVPLTLPTVIPGDAERAYRGADVAPVGERVRELTQVLNGPEVRLTGQWLPDHTGLSWVAEIGTPTEPLLYSPQRPIFYIGVDKSSITNVRVNVSGTRLASQSFASGGRAADKSLAAVSTDPLLTSAGYPLLEVVDSSRSTVTNAETLQEYSDELVLRGRRPTQTWRFTHNVSTQPYLSSFRAGDFAEVRVVDDPYLSAGSHVMRITGRSGDVRSKTVDLTFEPETA